MALRAACSRRNKTDNTHTPGRTSWLASQPSMSVCVLYIGPSIARSVVRSSDPRCSGLASTVVSCGITCLSQYWWPRLIYILSTCHAAAHAQQPIDRRPCRQQEGSCHSPDPSSYQRSLGRLSLSTRHQRTFGRSLLGLAARLAIRHHI